MIESNFNSKFLRVASRKEYMKKTRKEEQVNKFKTSREASKNEFRFVFGKSIYRRSSNTMWGRARVRPFLCMQETTSWTICQLSIFHKLDGNLFLRRFGTHFWYLPTIQTDYCRPHALAETHSTEYNGPLLGFVEEEEFEVSSMATRKNFRPSKTYIIHTCTKPRFGISAQNKY